MLLLNPGTAPRRAMTPVAEPAAEQDGAVWIDLLSPTEAERAEVQRVTGLRVPSEAELSEVESSSRLLAEGDTLYLSTPMSYRTPEGISMTTPLGFVLSPRHMLTVRFAQLPVFDVFAARFAQAGTAAHGGPATQFGPVAHCSTAAFVGLLEAVVDRLADVLEWVGRELDSISKRVFRADPTHQRNASRVDAELRATLRSIGRLGDTVSNLRDSLVGVNRIVHYVAEIASAWIPKDLRPRFKTLWKDVASLADYDAQLNNKVQFLLDATLGFINIEQANGIKVLTVVSVVGVPPTLVASIYGMNYQNMPELAWHYGYLYGLIVIALSAILPLVWFKWRGWV